jgi:predicted Zn-dependent peptidase
MRKSHFKALRLLSLMAAGALTVFSFSAHAQSASGVATTQVDLRIPQYRRVEASNGAVFLLMPSREVPLVAFQAILRGGALGDPADRYGLASLTAGLLEKGAGKRDAFAFADAVANVGGSFEAEADIESITVFGQFLARDADLMVELLADALQRPHFDAQQFEDLRARKIEFIKAAKDSDPSDVLPIYGNAFLFGSHPYGRPVSGSEASLASLKREDVQQYYRDHFGADRLVLVVAGDIDMNRMERQLLGAFGKWRRAAVALPRAPTPARVTGRRVLLVDAPGSVQTYFWIGNVGVPRRFEQRASLDLVNTLFGGRFTSMLNSELRIKSGLTYGARSRFQRDLEPGSFAISSFTQTDKTVEALDLALETYGRLHQSGVAADALDSAKAYVMGQYPLNLETAADWAGTIGDLEFYGLDRSYIDGYFDALRRTDVAAARRMIDSVYPKGEDLVFVFIGDANAIRDPVKKYGPVTEMAIGATTFAVPGR